MSSGELFLTCSRSKQEVGMNDAGEAFRHAGMTPSSNLDCFCDSGKCGRRVSLLPMGICKVSQNPGFVFQTSPSRSSEAERFGQVFYGRRKPSCDDVRKATTGLRIHSQIRVAALRGERVSAVGVLLSQSSVSLSPSLIYIG